MAVRLHKALTEARTLALGQGVTMDVKPLGFSRLSAFRARAMRLAQDRAADAGHAADQTVLAGDDAAEYRDLIQGLAEEILLDALIAEVGVSWDGVEGEDGTPVPLNAKTWAEFRACFPDMAERALQGIVLPSAMLDHEGNGSAPSSSGN